MKIIKTNIFSKFISGNNAITIGTIIFIKPELVDRQDIIEHEKVHVAQFKRQPFTFWLRYLFSAKWRLRYECDAFATQIRYLISHDYNADLTALIDRFANDIAIYYRLPYSLAKIRAELVKAYRRLLNG